MMITQHEKFIIPATGQGLRLANNLKKRFDEQHAFVCMYRDGDHITVEGMHHLCVEGEKEDEI